MTGSLTHSVVVPARAKAVRMATTPTGPTPQRFRMRSTIGILVNRLG